MWRASLILIALVAASCTAGRDALGEDRQLSDSVAPTVPDETDPRDDAIVEGTVASDTVASDEDTEVPEGSEVPAASIPSAGFDPSFDPATDPYLERQGRPRLAADPTERWSVETDRVTMPFAGAVGEVIVVHTVTPDDDHALVAFDRTDGTVVWRIEPGETIGYPYVFGDGLMVTLATPSGQRVVRLDGATGEERPLPADDNLGRRGRFVGAFTNGTCMVRNYDPSTGELVGEYCALGAGGPDTIVSRSGDAAVELDPVDLQPVSDPIPIDDIAAKRSVMVFGDTVVTYSLDALEFLDRRGEVAASIPDPGDGVMLTPAGAGSDVLIVYDYDVAIGLDVTTLTTIWQRPVVVWPFGVVDGEAFGLADDGVSNELFSLDTGETRCVIDADVVQAQNGFYETDGVAYDFDCVERWAIDVGDEGEIQVVDDGVVTVERTGDDTAVIRFLS